MVLLEDCVPSTKICPHVPYKEHMITVRCNIIFIDNVNRQRRVVAILHRAHTRAKMASQRAVRL